MKYQVPAELLDEYFVLIGCMECSRKVKSVRIYTELDVERARVHTRILESVGLDRTNEDFAMWLAEQAETTLRKYRRAA